MLKPGNKVLVSHRRMFKNDEPRYFVGEVLDYESGIVKLQGVSFVWDITGGRFLKKEQVRIKFVSLISGTFFVYQLPDETNVVNTYFESTAGTVNLCDGAGLELDMAEWPHRGEI